MKFSNIGIIVAARMGSTRLPGKAMLPLLGVPILKLLLLRLKHSKYNFPIILATTKRLEDRQLCQIAEEAGCLSFQGNEQDLIHRYVECAKHYNLKYAVRVTADCPFVDAATLDYFVESAFELPSDFSLATTKKAFPIGIDFELFDVATLNHIFLNAPLTDDEREHLTLYFYHHPEQFRIKTVNPPLNWKKTSHSFTIDTEDDYKRAIELTKIYHTHYFSVCELINRSQSCNSNILNHT